MTTRKSTCDKCDAILGLWQAVFTSECTHTFHLHCVSGTAACPACAARWTHAPATAPAPAPATPFAFASTTTDSSSSSASRTPLFGQPSPPQSSSIPFGRPLPATASQDLSGAHLQPALSVGQRIPFGQPSPATASQDSSLSLYGAHLPPPLSVGQRIPFGQQQAPVCVCPVCDAAMRRGQATVTSECNHTFHLRCIASLYWARSVCPLCRARWRHSVSLAPPPCPFSSPPTRFYHL